MIKKTVPGGKFIMVCDSCHVVVGHCIEFVFHDGQELMYSPILCEKCGTIKSEEMGRNVKHIQALEKTLKDLVENEAMKDHQGLIGWTYLNNGIKNLDYFGDK